MEVGKKRSTYRNRIRIRTWNIGTLKSLKLARAMRRRNSYRLQTSVYGVGEKTNKVRNKDCKFWCIGDDMVETIR